MSLLYLIVGYFFVLDFDIVLDFGILIDVLDVSVINWIMIFKFLFLVVGYFNIFVSGIYVGFLVFSFEVEIRLYFDMFYGINMIVENVKNVVSIFFFKGGFSRFDRVLLFVE